MPQARLHETQARLQETQAVLRMPKPFCTCPSRFVQGKVGVLLHSLVQNPQH